MKNYPKISVITPSFNQGKFLKRTIKSVLSQSYPNLEYIIKDAGSKDNSIRIIKHYAAKYPDIIKWVSKPDKGQSDGINQGIKLATGEIVGYLNSDDVYLPGALLAVGEFFNKNKNAMWVTGDYKIIDEKDKPIQNFIVYYKRMLRKLPHRLTLSVANYVAQPSTFWRSELNKEIGMFGKSHLVMDYEFWMRAIRKYKLFTIEKTLSAFRIHSGSKGKTRYLKQFNEEYKVAQKYVKNSFLLFLHKVHVAVIILIYKLIK